MMKQLLNTLYITKQASYAHLDNEAIRLEYQGQTIQRVPLHHLGAIITFGNVLLSPQLIAHCTKEGRSVALFDRNGRFSGRIEGPVSGNILLRQAQCTAHQNLQSTLKIAKAVIAGKIRNSRTLLMRAARENKQSEESGLLRDQARHLAAMLKRLERSSALNESRGIEGEAAAHYFSVFSLMLKPSVREAFSFDCRNRRPPLDPVNALLSFLYTLLLHDCVSALEGVGLDPREGFLHTIRPGRPALGLDLMEEFRAPIADRLALALINRKQVDQKSFHFAPGGAVYLNDEGRKTVIVAYQKRKQESLSHPLFKEKVEIGLLPHIQARLLARHLRGDISYYQPMIFR
jgi:CRISPR-associated protein Cas1